MNEEQSIPIPTPSGGFILSDEILDVGESAHKYITTHYARQIKIGFILSVLYIILVGWSLLAFGLLFNDLRTIILFFIPAFVYFALVANIESRMRREFYRQFALVNGYSYEPSWPEVERDGAIFKIGHDKKIEDYIQGQLKGLPFNLFNYFYYVGSGKSEQSYYLTVWEIELKTPLPPMMLMVDQQRFGDFITGKNINKAEKIGLDPEIEKIFSLWVEDEYEIEALQIFTPEFLQQIYNNYRMFSLDFAGTKMYIYCNKIIQNKADLDKLRQYVLFAGTWLEKVAPAMKGSILAMREALQNPTSEIFGQTGKNSLSRLSASAYLFIILFLIVLILTLTLALTNR